MRNAKLLLAMGLLMTSFARTSWGEPRVSARMVPAPNACGNQATAPQVTRKAIVSPPALDASGGASSGWNAELGRLEANGVEYVAADAVRVEILTDGCTQIQEIGVGSHVLTPSASHTGTLPNYYWYSETDMRNDVTAHDMFVWLGFPIVADGSTDDISITVGRLGGTGTAVYAFPLVHVGRVDPARSDVGIGFSNTEIYNQFAKALFAQFNGAANSVTVNGTRYYDYDPKSLGTSIDATGIWFSFAFKADITCQPKVRVTGTFTLIANAPGHVGLSVSWVNPATAHPDLGWCEVGAWLLGQIEHWATLTLVQGYGEGAGSVQKLLTDQIMKSLPDTSNVNLLLDQPTTLFEELRINLKVPAPSVEIDVPYDAFDMGRTATQFPSAQVVGVIANGIGMRDLMSGSGILLSGPNGVPLRSPTDLPNLETATRTGLLIDNSAAVAQLLARTTNSPTKTNTFRYTPGCGLTAPASGPLTGAPMIRFGVNDTKANAPGLRANGSSGYKVHVLFGFSGKACSGFSTGPVNQ